MPQITLFYIFLSSLVASLVMIPHISRLAIGMGILDKPDERKVHVAGTPRLGGIGIFFAFLLAVLLFSDIGRQERGFLAGAVIIFLIGLADDLAGLSPRQKFAGQAAAALTAVVIGKFQLASLGDLFGAGNVELGIFAIPFSVLAVVGVTNAVNLLDGLDGLAGGVSAIAAAAIALLAFNTENVHLMYLAVALAGAILGFLKYNTYPASIFMGDAGSLFLGYCMGTLSLLLVTGSRGAIHPVTPLMILAVPVIDTIYVMGKRLKARRSLFLPDNYHIHHRFLDLGVGHKLTVIVVYVFSYFLAALAVLYHNLPNSRLLAVLVITYLLIYLGLREFSRVAGKRRRLLERGNQSLRETAFYRRMVGWSHHLRTGIKYLIIAALALTISVPSPLRVETALISTLLLLLSGALLFTTRDWGNRFLLFVLYFDGAFLIYQMENLGRTVALYEMPVLPVSHLIYLALFLLVGMKIFLRNRTIEMASTPLEYLILFIVISTPLLPEYFTGRYHLLTVAGKSVILFAAYKLILTRQARRNRKIIVATLFALLLVAVKGWLPF